MIKETGNVSVSTENIFPIIRKWLYSDRDIFLRELVSNAADAAGQAETAGRYRRIRMAGRRSPGDPGRIRLRQPAPWRSKTTASA